MGPIIANATGSDWFGTSSFSVSLWALVTSSVGPYDTAWYKGGAAIGDPGYDVELGMFAWSINVGDGSAVAMVILGNEPELIGQWAHIVLVVDRQAGVLRGYANGVERGVTSIAGLGSVSSLTAATVSRPGFAFHGRIDELEIIGRALEPEWIVLHAKNVRNPSAVMTIE